MTVEVTTLCQRGVSGDVARRKKTCEGPAGQIRTERRSPASLASVVDEDLDGLAAKLEKREADIAAREAELANIEKELGRRETEVAVRERRVAEAERRAQRQPGSRRTPTPGRNEPCWCGSGKKYKHCHG